MTRARSSSRTSRRNSLHPTSDTRRSGARAWRAVSASASGLVIAGAIAYGIGLGAGGPLVSPVTIAAAPSPPSIAAPSATTTAPSASTPTASGTTTAMDTHTGRGDHHDDNANDGNANDAGH